MTDRAAVAMFSRLTALALACTVCWGPARADTLTSSASSASSASVGSLSDSITGSSNSSSAPAKVAEGDYRILEVIEVPERTAALRLKLQAVDNAAEGFTLELPRETAARQGLAVGHVVSARHRPYGVEFSRGDTREAFFLALTDDWKRELDVRPVRL